ncbi:MAG: hemerythrin domain-containing protein [Ramlibacter sp.]|nr:hemerythrin domain-containing protein [Ramlibacter sp.]MBX3659784.1 hemerythrin domain-containing protein [Ramlibacter sp.]MCW5651153.1 hemerythrin domain-containing protein [Ramlibacter sp.]
MTPSSIRTILDEHRAVSAVLRSLLLMVERGPGDEPERFFDVLRAMLFYIDEFPERLHHPKESDLLFPKVARRAPELMPVIERLEREHMRGEGAVRDLQHLLLAWELLGEVRRPDFVDAANRYVAFYLEHMKTEEEEVLPAAQRVFEASDWAALDAAFATHRDPLTGAQPRDPMYDRLFTRIVMKAPAPIGVGGA